MASLKGLYLGVYGSNGVIRALFLPLCYLTLLSPFFILVSRRYQLDERISTAIPEEYKRLDTLPQIFIALIAVLFATRAISGQGTGKNEGKRRVQLLPYWIPGAKHWGNIVLGGDGWLKGIRDSSISSIIAYNNAGSKHNVILSAPLLDKLSKQTEGLDEADLSSWHLLRNVFSLPNTKSHYEQLRPAITKTFNDELFKGIQLENIVSASLKLLSESLPDLVTFNSSVVDQFSWERVAGVELTDGTVEAEAELFALINEFFCSTVIPPIAGSQFTESYQLLASDLSTVNQFFYAIALGLPRFFPLPGLPGAVLAKNRLLQNFTKLFDDLTNPPVKRIPEDDESMSGEETDADTPTPLTALNELFTKHDVPIPARASIALHAINNIISEVVPLAFWTVLHIYASSATSVKKQDKERTPLMSIRGETKEWAEAIQPPAIHPSFPAPPEITITSPKEALSPANFPHLQSCINEAKRLYKASLSTIKITKPITLAESEPTKPGALEQWELDEGSYIDIGLSETLINTSPANYLSPNEYKPERFLNTPAPTSVTSSVNPSEPYTTALLVSLVAGITQLWNITSARKKTLFEQMQEAQAAATGEKVESSQSTRKEGTWVIPKAVDGATVKIPKGDVRVRIRRKEGLDGPKTMRKGR